ncbi:hypothetical protein BN1708_018148, partial [Verticillium longisporum]
PAGSPPQDDRGRHHPPDARGRHVGQQSLRRRDPLRRLPGTLHRRHQRRAHLAPSPRRDQLHPKVLHRLPPGPRLAAEPWRRLRLLRHPRALQPLPQR